MSKDNGLATLGVFVFDPNYIAISIHVQIFFRPIKDFLRDERCAEVLLQNHRNSSLKARLQLWVCGHDARGCMSKCTSFHFCIHDGAYPSPRACYITHHHDYIGRQPGNQHRQTRAELLSHLDQRSLSLCIALLNKAQKIVKRNSSRIAFRTYLAFAKRVGLSVIANRGGV